MKMGEEVDEMISKEAGEVPQNIRGLLAFRTFP